MGSTETGIRADLKASGYVEAYSDRDILYGGLWIRPSDYDRAEDIRPACPEYFDLIEITDLATASGADGQTLVSAYVVSFEYSSAQTGMRRAMDCIGQRPADLAKIARTEGHRAAQMALAVALCEYGIRDPRGYGNGSILAVTDLPAYRESSEKWIETAAPDPNAFMYSEVKAYRGKVWGRASGCDTVAGYGMAALRRAVNRAINL